LSLKERLSAGKFVITSEISPPKGVEIDGLLKDAGRIRNVVDAINITDNQRAIMRMSPLAACSILEREGYETIMHLTCRDRNRLALQSELLGAWSMGIRNILVMSGDHPLRGDHQGAKPVYDLDSVQLLGIIRELNSGSDFSGNLLQGKPEFFPGAVTGIELSEPMLMKLEKKIKMGATFIQTQAVFDTDRFSDFVDKLNDISSNPVRVMAGIIPLKSEMSIHFLEKNIAGIRVPDAVVRRMHVARDPVMRGMEIAAESIRELSSLCDGVHIMPVGDQKNTAGILEMAGIR
jgi:methylenetetrahydrofolate reductase (NADPH)